MQRGYALPRSVRLRASEEFAALAGGAAQWRAARQWIAAAAQFVSHRPTATLVEQPADRADDAAVEPRQAYVQTQALTAEARPVSASARAPARGLRVGFTVGRRQARRAVQRTMVKRVLRESARHGMPGLAPFAAERRIDIVLRLRSPLPDASQMNWSRLKRTLRAEADSLIVQLGRHLASQGASNDGDRTRGER